MISASALSQHQHYALPSPGHGGGGTAVTRRLLVQVVYYTLWCTLYIITSLYYYISVRGNGGGGTPGGRVEYVPCEGGRQGGADLPEHKSRMFAGALPEGLLKHAVNINPQGMLRPPLYLLYNYIYYII